MQFHNQDAQLRVYKDGETIFGELLISGKVLNKEKTFENFNIKEYEGKTLDCVLNGKKLFYKNEVIKEYVNVFPPQTILDLKVENGMGTILFNGIPVETIKCDLNLPAYKINVQNDENYTIVRYANLHQHTEGSLFDGITKISELANKTEYAGAITDHGNMFGWYEFKNSLEKKGKQPIIGEEFYMESFGGSFPTIEDNDDTEAIMFDKEKTQNEEGLNGEHLIVLAKNNQGIKNLFKLSSEAFLHYHKKPHITFELLKKYKEGLIVCSACIAGGINSFIKEYLKAATDNSVKKWIEGYGEFYYLEAEYQESPHSHAEEVYEYCHKKARESIDWYYENFKDDFYLEYQDHHFPLEKLIMDELVRIRNEEYPQIKIVATCDAHYLNKEDAYVHELWLCNQTKRKIDDPKHMRFVGDGYYVHTSEEMLELFPVEYLDATLEVADKVHYEKEKSEYHLPHFPLPKGFENEVDYLRHVSFEGFKAKFKGTDKYTNPLYRERLKSEFNTIVQMGWPAYFLIVSDFIKWAEDENVRSHWQDYFPDKTLDEIPNELLDKKKIYTGSGRGCVCAGTKVYTKDSLKNIEDIKVGEYVRTHTGELHKVIATHKYPIKEKLIKIDCLFGESAGNAYTADHKIYVIKHKKETNKSRLAKGIKYKTPEGEPEWISAKDVEIGDFVIQPLFTNDGDAPLEEIDLAKYLNKEDKFYKVNDSTIEWKRPSNVKSPFSTKAIRKETGVSYDSLKVILEKRKSKKENEVQRYLNKYGLSIDEWIDYYNANAYKTTVIPRYLKITEDLMYCLGLLTGDGWTRKNRTEWGICFNSESNCQDDIQTLEKTFSVKMDAPNFSKQTKLVQFYSNCVVYKRLLEDFWDGKYEYTAETKNIPNWVFSLSDNLKKALIKGLWASDGSNKKKTCYDSISFKLISKIKILLCMLKIPNGLVLRPAHYAENAKGKKCKDSWKIKVPKNFGDNKSVRTTLIKDKYVGKRVSKITEISGEDFVYDITVEKDHSYVTSSFVAHNSGAGSLMNYCLGITKVEPIIYDLKFERFLNPDRISMPDIDTDFEDENRGKVLDYVRFKYGKKKVANIITFNTAAAKNSVKIINRVTCGSVAKGNEIADLIPSEPGMTIEKAMENSDFKNRYENDKEVKNIVDLAKRIEGLKTAQSIHACFTKGTMITTKNGSVPIEEIEVGNEVLTHTGQYKKVLKLSGRSVDETLYEIKSSNGFATTCTGNHPYYVISKDNALNLEEKYEWVEAENLIPDKHLLVIPVCEKTNKNNKIREIWKIIGTYAYCVTNLHTNKIIGLKENFAKEILDTLKANRCNGVISRYNNEFSISINWKDKKVIRDLEQEKIPTELLLESKENIKLFLEGWFYYSKSSFKASSKEFVSDMVHLINIGMELPLNIEERQNKYFCSLAKEYEYHISQKYIYVPFEVSQKKESKTTTVYNLEVEDDHSYVANGKIVHNCATLICDETITNYMPEVLMTDKDTGEKIWVTQMEGPICEELGCLKMDFLGLRTLGYVKEAIASIKKNTGKDIDYDQIPLNDSKVYKYLADGNTPSVFQCESDMFTTVIKKTLQDVKKDPDSVSGDECFERLVAMNALVRPGSNLFIDDFADRIMHPEHITYLVPELKPILKETYGIILYQEQTMRITRDLAGFSAGQADTVRKAMGKKKKYIMDEYKDYFVHGNKEKGIKGCVANGIPEDKAIELWDVMALAASYSFNKSHAVAYSMHSIRTAWLSCYYPYEYLTAVLNSFASNTDKLSQYLNYARQRKMNIHTPSINKSDLKFTTDGTTILAGLSGIKGVSSSAKNIIEDRNKNGVFESLENFLYRMSFYQNFDKRTLESLIYAGVLDEYEGTRKDKLNSLVAMSEYVKNEKAYRKKVELYEEKKGEYEKALILYNNNQGKKPRVPKEPTRPTLDMIATGEEMPEFDKLMKELEYSGMFLTGNPMDLFKDVIKDAEDCSSVKKGKQNICGIVQELEKGNTKNGKTYYRFKLINNGSLSCISFDTEVIEKTVVKVNGNVSVDEFGASMVVNNVTNLLEEQKFINSLDDILIVTDDRSLAKQIQAINFPKGNRMVRILFEGKIRVLVKDVSININVMEKMNQTVGYRQIKTYERKQ